MRRGDRQFSELGPHFNQSRHLGQQFCRDSSVWHSFSLPESGRMLYSLGSVCDPYASGPDALAIGPINRWIMEEHRVQVFVRDNNVDQALKVLKKRMQREGIFREMKLRNYYEKPSEKRAREKAEAIRRARKLARKKAQREGLVSARPRMPRPTR